MSTGSTHHGAICNVCGGRTFTAGPNGRMSRTGMSPRCTGCQSLERHRQLRQIYTQIPERFLAGLDVLQLSPDVGVDPTWFGSYEVSEFGGTNSLDLESIDRVSASYDLVICNHVLEHVADDRQGLRELMRILRPGGLVQLTVPSPYTQERTVDWGYPKEQSHGHYRGYGKDIIQLFASACAAATVLQVEAFDDVTETGGYVYLWTQDRDLLGNLRTWTANPVEVG